MKTKEELLKGVEFFQQLVKSAHLEGHPEIQDMVEAQREFIEGYYPAQVSVDKNIEFYALCLEAFRYYGLANHKAYCDVIRYYEWNHRYLDSCPALHNAMCATLNCPGSTILKAMAVKEAVHMMSNKLIGKDVL